MSRKVSSTLCKTKQIPRIFQRRNKIQCGSLARNVWCFNDAPSVDDNAPNLSSSLSFNVHHESSESDNKHSTEYDEKKKRAIANRDYDNYATRTFKAVPNLTSDNLGSEVRITNHESEVRIANHGSEVKIANHGSEVRIANHGNEVRIANHGSESRNANHGSEVRIFNDGSEVRIACDGNVEKNAIVSPASVEDIEKWLKTRSESISSIDLDAMKCVVEEEDEEEVANVGVERYLRDDLPHSFLVKDHDSLSIDIDLNDKKLNLDYDPLLRDIHADKLLEVCEKNDDFIMPEFRLDHLDPLTLSPRDMMVAGEILPSTSKMTVNVEREKIVANNESSVDSEMTDRPLQSDVYDLAEELENIPSDKNTEFSTRIMENLCAIKTEIDPEPGLTIPKVECRSKGKSKLEPRIMKKRRKIRPKTERNEITFLSEPCHIDGKDGVMTVVAISTDKISNMTQIVINTGMDEQIYQGKTSELIEATGNFPKIAKIEVDADHFDGHSRPHEMMVSKALEEIGITDETLEATLIVENGKTWLCPREDCNREFTKLNALKAHLLAHYGVRPFKCDFEGCTWAFHSEFKLKRHKDTHLKRKNFVCSVEGCDRRFTTVYNLWSHEKLHNRPNRIICHVPDCNEKFQTKRALELHMRNHDQSHAPYTCNHEGCGKRYYTSNALTSHQRCHNYKEIDVKCMWPGCGKLFDKPCRLKAHVRSHTGCKPYTCTYQDCQWAFSSSSKLKRHQKKHTNERKFVCNVETCGKAFMRSEHLREHLLTHAGGGYFQCYMCEAHFSAKSSLYVHIKKHQVKDAVETIIGKDEKSRKNQDSLGFVSNDAAMMQEYMDYSLLTTNPKKNLRRNRETRKTVDKDDFSYNCGMEDCRKSYETLSNLGSHMIAMHENSIDDKSNIGVVNGIEESSDLDYIMYATPTNNSNDNCRTLMLESCDVAAINGTTKNLSPEPEPPPILSRIGDNFRYDKNDCAKKHNQGSARTGLTCDDVWRLKTRNTELGIVGATDVVLGTANLNEGLMLNEELPSMYYQDDIVGTECQILLLDSGNSEHPIDLRDLE